MHPVALQINNRQAISFIDNILIINKHSFKENIISTHIHITYTLIHYGKTDSLNE